MGESILQGNFSVLGGIVFKIQIKKTFIYIYMMKKIKFLILPFFVFVQSCSPVFYKKNKKFNDFYEAQRYEQAQEVLVQDKKSLKGKEKWIYLLNRGVVAHALGMYVESNDFFEEAYKMHEDFITKPLEEIFAFALNPNMAEYKGEDHEALLLHYYKALNYLLLNDLEKALVECRRLNIKLNLLADKYEDAAKYSRDAFIHTLMGIVYQASGEYNDAFIAYKNAVEIYETDYRALFYFSIPNQLKRDLIFCAYMSGFSDEVSYFKDKFDMRDYPPEEEMQLCDAVIFWHNGLGPVKDAWEINFVAIPGVGGGVMFQNEELGLCFPFPLSGGGDENSILDMKLIRVAFPKYVERPLYYDCASVIFSDKKIKKLDLVEDVNAISFLVLKERMVWELSKCLMRVALKQIVQYQAGKAHPGLGLAVGIFNFVTEEADTRNWQTLPHSIYYTRIKKPRGVAEFIFRAEAGNKYSNNVYEKVIGCDFELNKTRFIEVNTP